jgi:hypothetical protein
MPGYVPRCRLYIKEGVILMNMEEPMSDAANRVIADRVSPVFREASKQRFDVKESFPVIVSIVGDVLVSLVDRGDLYYSPGSGQWVTRNDAFGRTSESRNELDVERIVDDMFFDLGIDEERMWPYDA